MVPWQKATRSIPRPRHHLPQGEAFRFVPWKVVEEKLSCSSALWYEDQRQGAAVHRSRADVARLRAVGGGLHPPRHLDRVAGGRRSGVRRGRGETMLRGWGQGRREGGVIARDHSPNGALYGVWPDCGREP